jgi:molybdate transport system substrate-binding protein
MGDVKAVPAGKYGKAALESLGVWASVEGKVAQAENVRAALALVSTGEAPLGIVYKTDAVADPKVKVVGAFPPAEFASADRLPGRPDSWLQERRNAGIPEMPAVG